MRLQYSNFLWWHNLFQMKPCTYFAGKLVILLAILKGTLQGIHTSVDLVTKLSNNWTPVLLKEVSSQHENVVISPYGLMSSLVMIFEASGNKTRQEFTQAWNLTSEDAVRLRKGFKAYCDLFLKFSNDPEAAGSFNSVSMTSSFPLNPNYRSVLEKYYCANISEIRGNQNKTLELGSIAGVMSHWKNYDKLPVYTFLSHQTMAIFRKRDGSIKTIPSIPQVGIFRVGWWENSQVILLPLQAKLCNLLIIMPENAENMDSIIKKLTEFTIPVLVQSLQKQEVEVSIPQTIIVNKAVNLTSVVLESGIRRVFDPRKAELTKASSTNSNETIHLTKIEQNGFFTTSFVALNSVSGISTSSDLKVRNKRDGKSISLDRPFLFFLLQKDTQLVLLGGKLENPQQVPV